MSLRHISGLFMKQASFGSLLSKTKYVICFSLAPEIVNYEPLGLEADMW